MPTNCQSYLTCAVHIKLELICPFYQNKETNFVITRRKSDSRFMSNRAWYTEKGFYFLSNWMGDDQFSFWFWTKWKSIWFRIESETVTTTISHTMWKEIEYEFHIFTYECGFSSWSWTNPYSVVTGTGKYLRRRQVQFRLMRGGNHFLSIQTK